MNSALRSHLLSCSSLVGVVDGEFREVFLKGRCCNQIMRLSAGTRWQVMGTLLLFACWCSTGRTAPWSHKEAGLLHGSAQGTGGNCCYFLGIEPNFCFVVSESTLHPGCCTQKWSLCGSRLLQTRRQLFAPPVMFPPIVLPPARFSASTTRMRSRLPGGTGCDQLDVVVGDQHTQCVPALCQTCHA